MAPGATPWPWPWPWPHAPTANRSAIAASHGTHREAAAAPPPRSPRSKAPFSCLGWNASGWAGTSLRVWLGWNVDRRLRGTVEESPGAYSAFHLSSHATTGVVNTGRRSTPRHQTRLLIVSRQASRCDGALTGRKSGTRVANSTTPLGGSGRLAAGTHVARAEGLGDSYLSIYRIYSAQEPGTKGPTREPRTVGSHHVAFRGSTSNHSAALPRQHWREPSVSTGGAFWSIFALGPSSIAVCILNMLIVKHYFITSHIFVVLAMINSC